MSDLAALITAVIGLLGAFGVAIKFVWDKVESRFTKIEEELEDCRGEREKGMERRAVQLTVIEILWSEVKRIAPGADVLARAEKLLDQLKAGQ